MNGIEPPPIQKTPGVCGGDARIRSTRIPVWLLVLNRRFGRADADVLRSYPTLTEADLDAAWEYYRNNPIEVEQSIWLNDTAANVSEGIPPPAAIIVAGRLLGLDTNTICEAFDPPLSTDAVSAAWDEYRDDPTRINRDLASIRQAG